MLYNGSITLFNFSGIEKKLPPKLMCPKNIDQGIMPKKNVMALYQVICHP